MAPFNRINTSILKFDSKLVFVLLWGILSFVLFSPNLHIHGLEYRDDEIFYYRSTQEMLETGNYLSPTYFGQPRFQKPILYYWLILLSYKIFGINWFAARYVAVVFAALSVSLTWLMAERLFDRKVAHLSAIILMTIPLFFRHARNAVPDMPLNFFIVLAVYSLVCFTENPRQRLYPLLFFSSCGIGFMIKGFAALIIPFLVLLIFLTWYKKWQLWPALKIWQGLFILCLLIAPWFFFMVLIHGRSYLDHILVTETKERLMGEYSKTLWEWLLLFIEHIGFYFKNIFSYFAPWSFYLLPAALYGFCQKKEEGPQGIKWMLIWFFCVILFFSTLYFVINHYMLILTTPFAIIVAFFLVGHNAKETRWDRVLLFIKKYPIYLFFVFYAAVFIFLKFFLTSQSVTGFPFYVGIFAFIFIYFFCLNRRGGSPMGLGILLFFILTQSMVISQAGLTSHAVLQRFAQTLHREAHKESLITVGSRDIHEKEFQSYFEQPIHKISSFNDEHSKHTVIRYFRENKNAEIYCLITEKDYMSHFGDNDQFNIEVVQHEYALKRRIKLNSLFWKALFRFDQSTVYHFLMEKILLIRKKPS